VKQRKELLHRPGRRPDEPKGARQITKQKDHRLEADRKLARSLTDFSWCLPDAALSYRMRWLITQCLSNKDSECTFLTMAVVPRPGGLQPTPTMLNLNEHCAKKTPGENNQWPKGHHFALPDGHGQTA
jgi:hypothetical protein